MSVDISHRNLAWLSTADDVCSRRKRGGGENLPVRWGDGKEGWGVSWKLGEISDWGVCCGCHRQISHTLNVPLTSWQVRKAKFSFFTAF